jgi:hypothetical protein
MLPEASHPKAGQIGLSGTGWSSRTDWSGGTDWSSVPLTVVKTSQQNAEDNAAQLVS